MRIHTSYAAGAAGIGLCVLSTVAIYYRMTAAFVDNSPKRYLAVSPSWKHVYLIRPIHQATASKSTSLREIIGDAKFVLETLGRRDRARLRVNIDGGPFYRVIHDLNDKEALDDAARVMNCRVIVEDVVVSAVEMTVEPNALQQLKTERRSLEPIDEVARGIDGSWLLVGYTSGEVAEHLEKVSGCPVIDRAGLAESFEWRLPAELERHFPKSDGEALAVANTPIILSRKLLKVRMKVVCPVRQP